MVAQVQHGSIKNQSPTPMLIETAVSALSNRTTTMQGEAATATSHQAYDSFGLLSVNVAGVLIIVLMIRNLSTNGAQQPKTVQ
jgi:hypothetical protein